MTEALIGARACRWYLTVVVLKNILSNTVLSGSHCDIMLQKMDFFIRGAADHKKHERRLESIVSYFEFDAHLGGDTF